MASASKGLPSATCASPASGRTTACTPSWPTSTCCGRSTQRSDGACHVRDLDDDDDLLPVLLPVPLLPRLAVLVDFSGGPRALAESRASSPAAWIFLVASAS